MAILMNTGTGTGNRITCALSNTVAVGESLTMCCWVYRDTAGTDGHILAVGTDTSMTSYYGMRVRASDIYAQYDNVNASDATIVAASGAWQWIAVQTTNNSPGSGSVKSRYAAELATSISNGGSIWYGAGTEYTHFVVGDRAYGSSSLPYKNTVAHVRVWDAALSDAELLAEMQSATTVKTTNLVIDWPLVSDANGANSTPNGSITGANYSWVTGPSFGASAVAGISRHYARMMTG